MNTVTLLIATTNSHKVVELQALFAQSGLPVQCVSMVDVGASVDVEETGTTFEENAYIKAKLVHEATGLPVLADDSGLEVEALGGAPGVYSARYSGDGATDASNRKHLIGQLSQRGLTSSLARFRCVLCYVDHNAVVFGEGACSGSVIIEERGTHGFGYDSLFIPQDMDRTFGEITPEEKQALSHRGLAVQNITPTLSEVLGPSSEAKVDAGRTMQPFADALIVCSVAAALHDMELLERTIRSSVRTAEQALQTYEALLQTYLFAGFPTALESLAVFHATVSELLPTYAPPLLEPYSTTTFESRGELLCKQVYGSVYEKMMSRLSAITPDLSSWMIMEGYGKTLSRPGLDIISRELCIVAVLATLERRQQLVSHVRGALLVGATEEQLVECSHLVTEYAGRIRGEAVLRLVFEQKRAVANNGS